MSFADELRKIDAQAETVRQIDPNTEYFMRKMLSTIQSACQTAAAAGKRRISGYVRHWSDDGYEEFELVSALPSVAYYQARAAELNRSRKYADGGVCSVSTGTQEIRLYQEYLCGLNDLSSAQRVRQRLMTEIGKLGFTEYNVQIQTLEDTYVVYKTSASLFSRRASATVSTRKGPAPLYVPHIEIAW